MKNILAHNVPKSGGAVNVNVAMLTAAEKKVLQNSPAREISGGMVRLPRNNKFSKKQQQAMKMALKEANPSPVTRGKGRSYGGGTSSIVF